MTGEVAKGGPCISTQLATECLLHIFLILLMLVASASWGICCNTLAVYFFLIRRIRCLSCPMVTTYRCPLLNASTPRVCGFFSPLSQALNTAINDSFSPSLHGISLVTSFTYVAPEMKARQKAAKWYWVMRKRGQRHGNLPVTSVRCVLVWLQARIT